jgi:nitroreductase
MTKDARNQYPINELSRKRWSPRAFAPGTVDKEKLRSLFEAARWSASGGNEQPWRFIIGVSGDETWMKIFETLEAGNKNWAVNAPVLMISVGKKTRGKRNAVNFYSGYDTGQSVAHLSLEATHLGLHVHQMGGFSQEEATRLFEIPEDYQPYTAIAIGYLGDQRSLPEEYKNSEVAERTRKEFDEFVFSVRFGHSSGLF